MALNEKLISHHMATLKISRDEAIQLIKDDEAVDRMTSSKEIDSDLTDEQKKSAKAMRQADRKPTVYKFDSSTRKRPENADKRYLIDTINKALKSANCENIEITNVEREMVFTLNGVKYKVVLSAPRN